MNDLIPYDHWPYIFQYLSFGDILNFSSLCKKQRLIIRDFFDYFVKHFINKTCYLSDMWVDEDPIHLLYESMNGEIVLRSGPGLLLTNKRLYVMHPYGFKLVFKHIENVSEVWWYNGTVYFTKKLTASDPPGIHIYRCNMPKFGNINVTAFQNAIDFRENNPKSYDNFQILCDYSKSACGGEWRDFYDLRDHDDNGGVENGNDDEIKHALNIDKYISESLAGKPKDSLDFYGLRNHDDETENDEIDEIYEIDETENDETENDDDETKHVLNIDKYISKSLASKLKAGEHDFLQSFYAEVKSYRKQNMAVGLCTATNKNGSFERKLDAAWRDLQVYQKYRLAMQYLNHPTDTDAYLCDSHVQTAISSENLCIHKYTGYPANVIRFSNEALKQIHKSRSLHNMNHASDSLEQSHELMIVLPEFTKTYHTNADYYGLLNGRVHCYQNWKLVKIMDMQGYEIVEFTSYGIFAVARAQASADVERMIPYPGDISEESQYVFVKDNENEQQYMQRAVEQYSEGVWDMLWLDNMELQGTISREDFLAETMNNRIMMDHNDFDIDWQHQGQMTIMARYMRKYEYRKKITLML
jgi:hypothetical protein